MPISAPDRRLPTGACTDADPDAAEQTLSEARAAGIDLAEVTTELEREGVRSFCDSYHELLDCIEGKLGVVVS